MQVTKVQKTDRRVKAVRATRRSTELEGLRSTNATRADQAAYARGTITARELGDRVRGGTESGNRGKVRLNGL